MLSTLREAALLLAGQDSHWWQDSSLLATMVFGLVGVVGSAVTVIGYLDQRRNRRPAEQAFKDFARDYKGKTTEEQLQAMMSQLKNLPQQAQRVFLEQQLYDLDKTISELYSQRLETYKRLGEVATGPLDPAFAV